MPLLDAEKRAMKAATRKAALNMVEDLARMREVIANKQITPADLRRMSNLLRRILIDHGGDIGKIAPPRLDRRLMFLAPSVKRMQASTRKNLYIFASIGKSGLYGLPTDEFFIQLRPANIPIGKIAWATYKPPAIIGEKEQTISLHLDRFLSQPVLYFYSAWVTRREVIKYIAHVAGGVHTGDHKERNDVTLRRIRSSGYIKIVNGRPKWIGDIAVREPKNIERDGFDFALIQIMAAARYVTISPDVIELENIIRQEAP